MITRTIEKLVPLSLCHLSTHCRRISELFLQLIATHVKMFSSDGRPVNRRFGDAESDATYCRQISMTHLWRCWVVTYPLRPAPK